MKDRLDQFAKLKEEIGEYFGTTIYEGFDDMRYVKAWTLNSDQIYWLETEEYSEEQVEENDWEYSGEIYGTSIWRKPEFTLVRYDNGCGEKIYAIFDNSTEIKN